MYAILRANIEKKYWTVNEGGRNRKREEKEIKKERKKRGEREEKEIEKEEEKERREFPKDSTVKIIAFPSYFLTY